MREPLDTEIKKLLTGNPSVFEALGRKAMAFYHYRLPRRLRFLGVLHWVSKTAMASSAPGVAYFLYDAISVATALAVSAAIFVANFIVTALDAASKRRRASSRELSTETIIRVGDVLQAATPRTSDDQENADTIRAALGIIEIYCQQVTQSDPGEVSVSIAVYKGSSDTKMRL